MKIDITKISILLIFFLSACGTQPKPTISVKEKAIPQWFLNPPQSTSSVLYSIGEGKDRKDALSNALSNLTATLSISIESKFKNSVTTQNYSGVETYIQHTNNTIEANVKKIRISNYQILKAQKMGFDRYLILISANKSDIFNTIKDEVDKKLALLHAQEKSISTDNTLAQLSFYKKASQETQNLLYQSIILKVLNPAFKDHYIIEQIAHYKKRYTTIQEKISFSLHSNYEAKDLLAVIKDALNAHHLKIASKRGKYHFDLFVSASIIYTQTHGFTLARGSIVITLKDYKKQILSTKKIPLTGQSTQGERVAKENLAYKLNALIKKEGLSSILAIDL